MVRVNLIGPKFLADQHLIAEYNEILMLLGYVKKFPSTSMDKIPDSFKLGKGHMLFFKNKLGYLEKRHGRIKKEMSRRGFVNDFVFDVSFIGNDLINNWKPDVRDLDIIKKRLKDKINLKTNYYRYLGERKPKKFFLEMIKNAK